MGSVIGFYGHPTGFLYPVIFQRYLRQDIDPEAKITEGISSVLSKQICVQYFADVFENKISAKFTPDGVLWKQFAAAIWESAEEQEVLSQLFALVDQFSFLMIGNPRDL